MAITKEELEPIKAMLDKADTPLERCMACLLRKVIDESEIQYQGGSIIGQLGAAVTLDHITREYRHWNQVAESLQNNSGG